MESHLRVVGDFGNITCRVSHPSMSISGSREFPEILLV
jgi:hypothetical protein